MLNRTRTETSTTANLLVRLLRTPFAGFGVLIGIHVQALRLLLRGHHIRPRPAPPQPVSVLQPGTYSQSTALHSRPSQ